MFGGPIIIDDNELFADVVRIVNTTAATVIVVRLTDASGNVPHFLEPLPADSTYDKYPGLLEKLVEEMQDFPLMPAALPEKPRFLPPRRRASRRLPEACRLPAAPVGRGAWHSALRAFRGI